MTTAITPPPPAESTTGDPAFPVLTAAQIARVTTHGIRRAVTRGEVLSEAGRQNIHFFVVTAGQLEIVRLADGEEALVTVHNPGQFTGEVNMLSGRRSLFTIRAAPGGEVIEVEREQLLQLVQTDAELSEIFMRAFILRRVRLIARHFGDVVLIGSDHSPGTLRIREFLTRNGHPYSYIDLDRDQDVQTLLDRFHVGVA